MYVHGANLEQKEGHPSKYGDPRSRQFLKEIRVKYDEWKAANEALKGPSAKISEEDSATIQKRVELLNNYKNFLDQRKYAEQFDSRSNLHSSVLEEFMYYLFHDLIKSISKDALVGKSHTFKDMFFRPSSYADMLRYPRAMIERKDHDFAIGVKLAMHLTCVGQDDGESNVLDLPAMAIECKTYLDKTMLQDAATAAEQLKHRNPNAVYVVVAEWLKLTEKVNLKKYKIDQIYVLRKQKNTDREFRYEDGYEKNPIYPDAVKHLFDLTRTFLTTPWEGGIEFGLNRGFLL